MSGEFGDHMSGTVKSGVVRRSSLIASRARWLLVTGYLLLKVSLRDSNVMFTSQIKLISKQSGATQK